MKQKGSYLVFDKGSAIVHPKHGAGILTEIKKLNNKGGSQKYYIIELIGKDSSLMIPIDRAEEINLRKAEKDPVSIVSSVFSDEHVDLDENNQNRSKFLTELLDSCDLTNTVAVLRDLAFFKALNKPTANDRELMKKAENMIASEIAAIEGIKLDSAKRRLSGQMDTLVLPEKE